MTAVCTHIYRPRKHGECGQKVMLLCVFMTWILTLDTEKRKSNKSAWRLEQERGMLRCWGKGTDAGNWKLASERRAACVQDAKWGQVKITGAVTKADVCIMLAGTWPHSLGWALFAFHHSHASEGPFFLKGISRFSEGHLNRKLFSRTRTVSLSPKYSLTSFLYACRKEPALFWFSLKLIIFILTLLSWSADGANRAETD